MTSPCGTIGSGCDSLPVEQLPRLDGGTFDLANRFLCCLGDMLAHTVTGPVCRLSLYHGDGVIPADHCCGCDGGVGMAGVKVYRIAPSTARFPQQDFAPRTPCARNSYVVTLEVTIYRCIATIDQYGDPPTVQQLTREAAASLDDAAAIRRALRCCFAPQLEDGSVLWSTTGRYVQGDTTFTADGDCAGVTTRVDVEYFEDCSCDAIPDPPPPGQGRC